MLVDEMIRLVEELNYQLLNFSTIFLFTSRHTDFSDTSYIKYCMRHSRDVGDSIHIQVQFFKKDRVPD